MQNTYQDLITAVQNKNPAISPKLEGGRKFQMKTDFKPAGDQPEAIKQLVNGANKEQLSQVLLGVTGSGKTFTMAKVIEKTNRPALILAPNKTLAAQLYGEMKSFFPDNAVEYFVSYYDYYTPEAYVPRSDTYIEKEASINEQIDRMRHSATRSLLERDDVIIVSGHNLGTAEIESAFVAHPKVAEAAVVGFPHSIKGNGLYCYVTLNVNEKPTGDLERDLKQWVRKQIGPICYPDVIQFAPGLPKTRSGKIMRRILRKIAANEPDNLGDTTTLADPSVVASLVENRQNKD